MSNRIACPVCDGSGDEPSSQWSPDGRCRDCGGRGYFGDDAVDEIRQGQRAPAHEQDLRRAIRRDFWKDGLSEEELARKYGLPRSAVSEVLKIYRYSYDLHPVLSEEAELRSLQDNVPSLLTLFGAGGVGVAGIKAYVDLRKDKGETTREQIRQDAETERERLRQEAATERARLGQHDPQDPDPEDCGQVVPQLGAAAPSPQLQRSTDPRRDSDRSRWQRIFQRRTG